MPSTSTISPARYNPSQTFELISSKSISLLLTPPDVTCALSNPAVSLTSALKHFTAAHIFWHCLPVSSFSNVLLPIPHFNKTASVSLLFIIPSSIYEVSSFGWHRFLLKSSSYNSSALNSGRKSTSIYGLFDISSSLEIYLLT